MDNNIDTGSYWYSVCYGNGKFVAVAYGGSKRSAYSYDNVVMIDYPIVSPNVPADLTTQLARLDNNSHSWQEIYPVGSIYTTTETFSDLSKIKDRLGFGTWVLNNPTGWSSEINFYKRTA